MQSGEHELVARSQSGDRSSFDVLVRRYHTLAYNLAYRMLGNHDSAADCTQAAFVRAYRAIGKFRRDASFSTWLYRIVTNVCLDRLRQDDRSARSLTVVDTDDSAVLEEMDIPDQAGDPARAAEQRERQQLVQEALQRLGDDHRSVIVMFDIMGLSYEETAQALAVPLGTVKSRLNRARLALKDELAGKVGLFP